MRAFYISSVLAALAITITITGANAAVAIAGFNVSLTVPSKCSAVSSLTQLAISCSTQVPYSYSLAPANDATTSQGSGAAIADGRASITISSDAGLETMFLAGSGAGRSSLAKRLAKLKADRKDADKQIYIMSVVY